MSFISAGSEPQKNQAARRRALAVKEWLWGVRKSRGMSQEAVAYAAGIAVSTYGRLERIGRSDDIGRPTVDTLLRVCAALEVSCQEWLELDGVLTRSGVIDE